MVGERRTIEGSGTLARTRRAVFGDRIGETAFLATVVLFAIFWVIGWRINDSITLLNTLEGMGEGRLFAEEAAYGTSLETPGANVVDGEVYGRNYGILTLALLPLVAVRALGAVADLGVVLPGLWSLAILALGISVGHLAGRRRVGVWIGGVLAVGLFAANLAVAGDLNPSRAAMYALQFTHLVVAAMGVVVTYRLLARMQGARSGAFAATLVALGTPIGLWATIPKRHVITATAVLVVAYALYRSRTADPEGQTALGFRAGAYAVVGLLAWVVAPEALLVFLVLVAVDLPTAGRYDVRSWVVLAGAMAVSLVPFFVTNVMISGSPVRPPRALGENGTLSEAAGGGGGGGGGGGELLAPIDPVLSPFATLGGLVGDGIVKALTAPAELVPVLFRSGTVESVTEHAIGVSVNLSLLETSPILAAALGVVPVAVAWRGRPTGFPLGRDLTANRIVDTFLALFVVFLTLLYVPRLPLHAQITVRYLFPIVPVLVVLIVRLPAVRGVLADHLRTFAWTVAVAVLVGGQLVVVALVALDPRLSEAFQFHALLSLAISVPLGLWSLRGRSDGHYGRVGAILIGLATAAATVFLLLVTLDYFAFGNQHAIPVVRVVAEVVSIV